jgi:hypothetical protein
LTIYDRNTAFDHLFEIIFSVGWKIMKKSIAIFLLLMMQNSLFPQIGEASAQSIEAGSGGIWKNWVFGAGALVVAAGGMVAVALNSGDNPATTSH